MNRCPVRIDFSVSGEDSKGLVGTLTAVVDGLTLFTLERFPLSDLARQLLLWATEVDDVDHCSSFVYRDQHDRWLGAFRIEPRPQGWQFTSVYEDRRHETMLDLREIRESIRTFSTRLSQS